MAACGRRGAGAIVACVAPRGTAEVVAGAPALRESGAYVPFERDKCLRPLRRVRGEASERPGAVRGGSKAWRDQAGHRGAAEPANDGPS